MSPEKITPKEAARDKSVVVNVRTVSQNGFGLEQLKNGWRIGFTFRNQVDEFLSALSDKMPSEFTEEEKVVNLNLIADSIKKSSRRASPFMAIDELSIVFSNEELVGVMSRYSSHNFNICNDLSLRFANKDVIKETFLLLLTESYRILRTPESAQKVLKTLGLPNIKYQ